MCKVPVKSGVYPATETVALTVHQAFPWQTCAGHSRWSYLIEMGSMNHKERGYLRRQLVFPSAQQTFVPEKLPMR